MTVFVLCLCSSVEKLRTMIEDVTEFLDAIWDVYCSEGEGDECGDVICLPPVCSAICLCMATCLSRNGQFCQML